MSEIWSGYISAPEHQIFQIIVSTSHSILLSMGSMDKNFEDLRIIYMRYSLSKFHSFHYGTVVLDTLYC